MTARKPSQRQATIRQITGVSQGEAPIIERLMSETILHSTLDWLSPEEFSKAAIEAHQLFKLAPPYFHSQQKYVAMTFKRLQAQNRLERVEKNGNPQTIAKAREQLDLCRHQEQYLATICQRLGQTYFPFKDA